MTYVSFIRLSNNDARAAHREQSSRICWFLAEKMALSPALDVVFIKGMSGFYTCDRFSNIICLASICPTEAGYGSDWRRFCHERAVTGRVGIIQIALNYSASCVWHRWMAASSAEPRLSLSKAWGWLAGIYANRNIC